MGSLLLHTPAPNHARRRPGLIRTTPPSNYCKWRWSSRGPRVQESRNLGHRHRHERNGRHHPAWLHRRLPALRACGARRRGPRGGGRRPLVTMGIVAVAALATNAPTPVAIIRETCREPNRPPVPAIDQILGETVYDCHVLAQAQKPDARRSRLLLRACHNRPRGGAAANEQNELAPSHVEHRRSRSSSHDGSGGR